jgi:hypothetical protein
MWSVHNAIVVTLHFPLTVTIKTKVKLFVPNAMKEVEEREVKVVLQQAHTNTLTTTVMDMTMATITTRFC